MRLVTKETEPTEHEKRIANWFKLSAAPAAQPMTEQEIAYGFEVWQSSPAPEGWHFASDKTRARVAFMDGVRYAEKRLDIKEQS